MAPARLRALFIAYLAATALHLGFVVAHEPFAFDAWNVAVDTGARPATVERFFAYWHGQYAHSNPRLGQPLTYLAYKLAGFAEVATPLAYLALTLAITVIGLGRLPRRGRDLALWAVAVGACWFVLPDLGRNLFNRAYAANYVYAAAIQLWFVAWLRLAGPERARPVQWLSFAAFGTLAGMCNEHTGPALVVLTAGYAWWQHREGASPRCALAGAAGALAGVLAILLAPGQSARYGGLLRRAGLAHLVLARGFDGALGLLRDYLGYAAPVLALIAIALLATRSTDEAARRRAARVIVVGLAAGVIVVGTLCASPKLGSRFYIAPLALLLAGLLALLDATRVRVLPFVAAAVLASGYAAARTIPLYARVSEQSAARLAALEASAPGTVFVASPFEQIGESWWFIGDDFRSPSKRRLVARYFGLARVALRTHHRRRSR